MTIDTGSHLMLTYKGDASCLNGRYDYGMIGRLFDPSMQERFEDFRIFK